MTEDEKSNSGFELQRKVVEEKPLPLVVYSPRLDLKARIRNFLYKVNIFDRINEAHLPDN